MSLRDEGTIEERVKQCDGLGLVAWKQVAVEVEGHRDRVDHVAAQRMALTPAAIDMLA